MTREGGPTDRRPPSECSGVAGEERPGAVCACQVDSGSRTSSWTHRFAVGQVRARHLRPWCSISVAAAAAAAESNNPRVRQAVERISLAAAVTRRSPRAADGREQRYQPSLGAEVPHE